MPEGKTIDYQEGEYPELDGLADGSSVKFEGSATIQDNGNGGKSLVIDSMEFETEGMADRELRKMKGGDQTQAPEPESEGAGQDF